MSVLDLRRLEETTLWKHLHEGFSGQEHVLANTLAVSILPICNEAAQRMKSFPSLHPEYTLHDETHLLRVTELMAMILGDDMLHKLNPIEIALLILAAYFHDQGMVIQEQEIRSLPKNPDYMIFRQNWILQHPTLAEVQDALGDNNLDATELSELRYTEQQLLDALLTDYIRTTHGKRSEEFVLSEYGTDPRWKILEVNLTSYVAKLAKSHVKSAFELNEARGFRTDESIGNYDINLVYLGLILRLADILDFDRDRTPDSLYRSIHFSSPVSLGEWEKHRTIRGWKIDSETIRFTALCEHPEYERAVRYFMDWIDNELSDCHAIVRKFPKLIREYTLDIPQVADRSRIGPKDGAYIYHDLEFSLSRDQIVKLLMTDRLYGSNNLCIRELLQNSLDALRLRKAIFWRDSETIWNKGRIHFEHFIDEAGYEIIRCTDNGIGMDEKIITKFLTNVGRSYYKSPEFEQEKQSLKMVDADFEPISQFGIGFMSCFMLGDRIKIFTKKDYGLGGGSSKNLLVEINGLGGILTIKELDNSISIGTIIEIQCGKFEGLLNYFSTKASVLQAISEVMIGAEFPISVESNIPEKKQSLSIPNEIFTLPSPQEIKGYHKIVTERFDFSILNNSLQGSIAKSFLTNTSEIDGSQEIVLSNSELMIMPADMTRTADGIVKRQFAGWYTSSDGINSAVSIDTIARIAFDGIYICGDYGYNTKEIQNIMWGKGIIQYGLPLNNGGANFTLNVRGKLKAPLTPARGPLYDNNGDNNLVYEWRRLLDYILIGSARIYERLIAQKLGLCHPHTYWELMTFEDVHIEYMRMGEVWEHLRIPCVAADKTVSYVAMDKLGPLTTFHRDGKWPSALYTQEGLACYMVDKNLWRQQRSDGRGTNITDLLISFSTLSIRDGKYLLTPSAPLNPEQVVGEMKIEFRQGDVILIPYLSQIHDTLFVITYNSPETANSSHAVIKLAFAARNKLNKTPIERFCLELMKLNRAHEDPLVKAIEEDSEPDSITVRLGLLYAKVNWDEQTSDLRPPYKILFSSGTEVTLSSDSLLKWSKQYFSYNC